MVNSPSRPNSRPDAPPAPVDCGGLTPHWHREPCLPVQRTGRLPPPAIRPNQTKSNHVVPFAYFAVTLRDLRFPLNQGRKPQQSRLIVPNQASSRQTMNYLMVLPPPVAIFNLAFSLQHWAFYPKTPVIVPHQGISRHTPKKPIPLEHSSGACRLALGISWPHPLCDFATPRLCVKKTRHQGPIKAKTPVIVLNQASSRQTPKIRSVPVPGRGTDPTCQPPHHARKSGIREARPGFPKQSNQIRPNQTISPAFTSFAVPPISETRNPCPIHPQSRQKTPVIVPHQGISRHPPKKSLSPSNAPQALAGWHWESPGPILFATLRLRAFALKKPGIKAQSRQKPL